MFAGHLARIMMAVCSDLPACERPPAMSLYLQYHNCDKEGLPHIDPGEGRFGIFTRREQVKHARGTVFLIVGLGKPRKFFLWEVFTIDKVKPFAQDGRLFYRADGPGWQLSCPQRLVGPEFDAFASHVKNLRHISQDLCPAVCGHVEETRR